MKAGTKCAHAANDPALNYAIDHMLHENPARRPTAAAAAARLANLAAAANGGRRGGGRPPANLDAVAPIDADPIDAAPVPIDIAVHTHNEPTHAHTPQRLKRLSSSPALLPRAGTLNSPMGHADDSRTRTPKHRSWRGLRVGGSGCAAAARGLERARGRTGGLRRLDTHGPARDRGTVTVVHAAAAGGARAPRDSRHATEAGTARHGRHCVDGSSLCGALDDTRSGGHAGVGGRESAKVDPAATAAIGRVWSGSVVVERATGPGKRPRALHVPYSSCCYSVLDSHMHSTGRTYGWSSAHAGVVDG